MDQFSLAKTGILAIFEVLPAIGFFARACTRFREYSPSRNTDFARQVGLFGVSGLTVE
jgi:hypothetical protein